MHNLQSGLQYLLGTHQREMRTHARLDDVGIEGLADVIDRPQLQAGMLIRRIGKCRDEDHRDTGVLRVLLQILAHLIA